MLLPHSPSSDEEVIAIKIQLAVSACSQKNYYNHGIFAETSDITKDIALVYCYVLCNRAKQVRLLDLARGVDRERVDPKFFQFNRATKLPVRTTHGNHMRLYLLNGFAFQILHDGKWLLSEGWVGNSNDDRLRFMLVFRIAISAEDHSPVTQHMPADRTQLQPVLRIPQHV